MKRGNVIACTLIILMRWLIVRLDCQFSLASILSSIHLSKCVHIQFNNCNAPNNASEKVTTVEVQRYTSINLKQLSISKLWTFLNLNRNTPIINEEYEIRLKRLLPNLSMNKTSPKCPHHPKYAIEIIKRTTYPTLRKTTKHKCIWKRAYYKKECNIIQSKDNKILYVIWSHLIFNYFL